MNELTASILKKLKTNEVFAIIFISLLFVTFIPDSLAIKLSVFEIRKIYQQYISLTLILILAYYLYCFIINSFLYIKSKIWSEERHIENYLKNDISDDEKILLIENFYDLNNKTFHLSSSLEFANGTKTALEINNIIYRSSNITRGFNIEVDYNLNNYALKVLNRNVKQGNIVIKRDSFCFNIK